MRKDQVKINLQTCGNILSIHNVMDSHHFLAYDLGASSGRAIIGTLKNRKLSLKEVSRFPNDMLHIHGHDFWNIFSLYEEMKKVLVACVTEHNLHPESLGVDTWGVDFTLLDKHGIFLSIPYAYRDHRTDDAMEEVFRLVPKEEIYRLTGIAFWQFNSLYQLYAWKRDQPDVLHVADNLLFMPDIFNYLFSGERKSEFTFATTSQLFNPISDDWEPVLFDKLNLPLSVMNKIVKPGTVIGELTGDLADLSGLKELSVIAVASHDTGSAIAAIPAEGENWAYISSGTWSLMGIESSVPLITTKNLEYNFTNEGGVENTFRFLKNIMGLWLLQECRRIWARAGKEYSYSELIDSASQAESFRSVVNPDWLKFYNPPDMPEAIREFCRLSGQKSPNNAGEFVRCILESLALKYRLVLDQLREVSGKSLDKLHIIGGGTQNQMLCQFTANATGIPVITGPAEATAAGNLMVQALAKKCVTSLVEIRQVIRNSFESKTYLPEDTDKWDEAYMHFVENIMVVQ